MNSMQKFFRVTSVHEFALSELGLEISTDCLETIFDCLLIVIKRALQKRLRAPKSRDHHRALANEVKAVIFVWTRHHVGRSLDHLR
jgi:hypothetical protein